jgi:predicted ATP-dependent serine protease
MKETYYSPMTRKRFRNQAIKHGFQESELDSIIYYKNESYLFVGFHSHSNSRVVLDEATEKMYIIEDESISETGKPIEKKPLIIEPIKMDNVEFDPNIFIPMKTNTPIDYMFSTKGGIFPGTNYMIIGDPGIGKSTLTLDILGNIEKSEPDRKVLFISGEMNRIDMYDYVKRYPKFGKIDTIFLGEYLEENPKEIIETIFKRGYDLILTDSFIEVQESVQASSRMNRTQAEKWLIDLMVLHNQANNDAEKYTSFLMIQQVTKGGNFVGSNKLKHNTTGMMEMRYSNEFSGDRYITFTKNRRGGKYERLFFSLDKIDDVHYDMDRLKRDLDIKERIANEKENLIKEEQLFNQLFNAKTKEESSE